MEVDGADSADDADDTVIRPPRRSDEPARDASEDMGDTVVHSRSTSSAQPVASTPEAPAEPPEPELPAAADVSGLFYRLNVGPGREPVLLDVPCVVGRNPSAPRVVRGRSPRLVRVASASKEVSATHVEVLQLGSTVVVTDLDSTNGSIVRVPGRAPRMLRQGESVAVTPGTVVDIGDGNLLEILPLPHPGLVRREGDSDGARR